MTTSVRTDDVNVRRRWASIADGPSDCSIAIVREERHTQWTMGKVKSFERTPQDCAATSKDLRSLSGLSIYRISFQQLASAADFSNTITA
jgi:hypothetical protein